MTSSDHLATEVRTRYPSLRDLPPGEFAAGIEHEARLVAAPAGTGLFGAGDPCQGFPLVLSGEISVARQSSGGRTLELYRVLPGDVCVVSAACLLGRRALAAHGTAVRDTRLLLLGAAAFERWTAHAPFRRVVFGVFAERLSDLMEVVDAVAFQRLDRRLAAYLLGHGLHVRATHQAIADELGTVREMVTRLLNRFELAGYVTLGRGRVDVVNADGLRLAAAADPGRG